MNHTAFLTIVKEVESKTEVENKKEVDLNAIERFVEELPDKALRFGVKVVLAFVILFIGAKLIKLVRRILCKSLTKANAEKGVVQFLDSFIKVVLYVVLIVTIATYFGASVAGMVTLLGSAGVAIGLSLQGSLGNLAGGVLILLLKPFRVGDYIVEDNHKNEGTVTEIQMFYTKLTTPDNRVIILPNGALANTSLTNVSAMPERRLDLKVGIAYGANLQKAKEIAEGLVREQEKVLQEKPVTVFVDSLGDSSVTLGIRCHVNREDYWEVKWQLTERLKLAFDKNGIEIPFPQVDVHTRIKL